MTTAAYRLRVVLPLGVRISTIVHVDGRSARDCDRHVHQLIDDLYPDAEQVECLRASLPHEVRR